MGYYTNYNIKVVKVETEKFDALEIIDYIVNKINEKRDYFYPFENMIKDCQEDIKDLPIEQRLSYIYDLEFSNDESAKWYDNNDDMLELSKQFPDIVFLLEGEGEEAGDLWKTYYKSGKKQNCPGKIIYDEYDESKLE